jgi:inorganic phosphate transporter, PiT family
MPRPPIAQLLPVFAPDRLLPLAGGVYLGWALGANDAANVFGTAVAARIIRFRNAALLCAFAVLLGAVLQGEAGIRTYSGLSGYTGRTLVVATFAAALTVTLMTVLRLPISTSQAVVGAIAGIGLSTGTMNYAGLRKVLLCWLATPFGAMLAAVVLYALLRGFFRFVPMSLLTRDKLLWGGLVLAGVYGSYALGANNVANATGMLSGILPGMEDRRLALLGGVAIALGVLTFSRRVMMAVGSGILPLEAQTAFVAVASMSATVHVFAMLGVPVSTSQAIVGALLGIGGFSQFRNVRFTVLRHIVTGWVMTPALALLLSAAGYAIFV